MIRTRACRYSALILALIMSALFSVAVNAQSSIVVPRLVNFSGKATDAQGKVLSGVAGATFAIYKDQHECPPLWLETQNVQADAKSQYTVQLGATKPDGLPLDLFSSGEARWLGVTVNGGTEQPRVLLLSVPYALKAADAEWIDRGLLRSRIVHASKLQRQIIDAEDFCDFCKRHRREIVGHRFMLPPRSGVAQLYPHIGHFNKI